jgi:hypothetical protein
MPDPDEPRLPDDVVARLAPMLIPLELREISFADIMTTTIDPGMITTAEIDSDGVIVRRERE